MDNRNSMILIITLGLIVGGEAVYISIIQQQLVRQRTQLADLDLVREEYDALSLMNNDLKIDYENIKESFDSLVTDHNILERDHSSLEENYASTQSDYTSLDELYTSLLNQHSSLESSYETMEGNHLSLQNNYSSLQETYSTLQNQYESLLVESEDIYISDQEYKQFVENMVDQVNMRLGRDEGQQFFVTPSDSSVEETTLQIVGSLGSSKTESEQWLDIRAIYNWLTQNIQYVQDSPYPHLYANLSGNLHWHDDCFRFPNETIRADVGDCEDQAMLLLSLLLNYGETDEYWCIRTTSDSGDHMAVALPVSGGRLVILDPAGNYYSGKETGSIIFREVEAAIDNWFTVWGYTNMMVYRVFNDGFFETFSSNQEFYDWFHNNHS